MTGLNRIEEKKNPVTSTLYLFCLVNLLMSELLFQGLPQALYAAEVTDVYLEWLFLG